MARCLGAEGLHHPPVRYTRPRFQELLKRRGGSREFCVCSRGVMDEYLSQSVFGNSPEIGECADPGESERRGWVRGVAGIFIEEHTGERA